MDDGTRSLAGDALVAWATIALIHWARGSSQELPDDHRWLGAYGRLLSSSWSSPLSARTAPVPRLSSVFHAVSPAPARGGGASTPCAADARLQMPTEMPRPLQLDTIVGGGESSPEALLAGFQQDLAAVGPRRTPAALESFGHVLRRYAWTVPCTFGEEGVSLYEEVKALAAAIYASHGATEPAEEYLLVGGDFSGIREFIYTITSAGAAKGLRGRSLFLQLLGDAIVRRVIRDLSLCWANVIYEAGGNFLVLAPADESTQRALEAIQREANAVLLAETDGDLALLMAWERVSRGGQGFAAARQRVGAQLAAEKDRRYLKEMRDDGWTSLFMPSGKGADNAGYCKVCHRELTGGEVQADAEKCAFCKSFGELARDIAHDGLWMTVQPDEATGRNAHRWQDVLTQISGYEYRFVYGEPPEVCEGGYAYRWNSTEGISDLRGFRFVANATPHVEEEDVSEAKRGELDPLPTRGDIMDFSLMAAQADGIKRVGVLRMDVDNLGTIFGEQLRASMAQVSALSASMALFFCGHLNRVCSDAEANRARTLYTIYAGGDDLFVVGAWDRMPELAERIRDDLFAYTGRHGRFTVSGGVTLEDAHFPLYRAAERSEEAEHAAKTLVRGAHHKDAFCFLGTAVGWEKWGAVKEMRDVLEGLMQSGVPRSLLGLCANLHALWARAADQAAGDGVRRRFGRWMWMSAYRLTRMAEAYPHSKEVLLGIQQQWIAGGESMRWLGLAARWADYRTRGGSG